MRINQVSAILGRRGTGKTVYIKKLIEKYREALPDQKILIVDTLDHPAYRHIPVIKPEKIKYWASPSIYRIYSSNPESVMEEISQHLSNALIIFEDASKYIRYRLPDSARQFIFDSKQKNLDLIFLFHGFAATPPELFRVVDNLVIFKTDHPQVRKNMIPNYEEVLTVYNRIKKSKNPYDNETVRIY